ncbi:hypothetical protein DFH94DRAFT_678376 [Russula ochroleuca]|uniref:FMN-dependent dehydrogenase domain-containing protein n=1 Tax=Russula ochroleuca TaxID=152965 RepID=A0A9P5N7F5_9AGAM|nr:hypothetical protein DFH94DRAFT_678376 [Russula ochroleuca]
MRRMGGGDGSGLAPRPDERTPFPLDLDVFRARLAAGDEQALAAFTLGAAWLREGHSGTFRSWKDIAFLRENWDGPIVLTDAHAAMHARVDGIIVSNHGGRQVDGAIGLFSALEKITASSKIRSGAPIMYGLALGGEEGVEEVLRALLADTEITLGICGYMNID